MTLIQETYIILVSCRIPWLRKAPKVIFSLEVAATYWLKQLDDLSTVVMFVQLEKRLKLNYFEVAPRHLSSSPLETKVEIKSKIRQELMEEMRKKADRMRLEL